MTRNKFYNLYVRHHWVLRLRVLWLRFLMLLSADKKSLQERSIVLRRNIGFSKVLNKGDIIAVQGGVCMNPYKRKRYWYDNWSQLWMIAKHMGPKGVVVAVEPNPDIAEKIKDVISVSNFKCSFIVVNKALASSNEESVKFQLGSNLGQARLHDIRNSETWWNQETRGNNMIEVPTTTLDEIFREHKLDPTKVAFINLTINGAEYDALLGMKNVLQKAKDICVSTVAGRENEGYKGKEALDIGYIEGRPDYEVMTEYMEQFGYKSNLVRYTENRYGMLVSLKGNQKPMLE